MSAIIRRLAQLKFSSGKHCKVADISQSHAIKSKQAFQSPIEEVKLKDLDLKSVKSCEEQNTLNKEIKHLKRRVEKVLKKIKDPKKKSLVKFETTMMTESSSDGMCVICMGEPATICTYPCHHKVVCKLCFLKHLHCAVSQRQLQVHCVICRCFIERAKVISDEEIIDPQNCQKFPNKSDTIGIDTTLKATKKKRINYVRPRYAFAA